MVVRARPSRHGTRIGRLLMIGAAAGTITLAGCGTAVGPGTGTGGPAAPSPAKVALSFTVRKGPASAITRWTLRCDPPGGSLADPGAACTTLLAMKSPFGPRPAQTICPMIMASSGQIVVTGTWFGQKVHRVVVDGGCDLGLFGTLGKILR